MQLSNRKICIIINAITVMAICVTAYIVMTRPSYPSHHLSRAEFPIKGIDISAHNGHIDFGLVTTDTIDFVMIKATEGADFCDANFNINYNGARAHNLPVGAYHFFRFETPGAVQASHFINTIAGKDFERFLEGFNAVVNAGENMRVPVGETTEAHRPGTIK